MTPLPPEVVADGGLFAIRFDGVLARAEGMEILVGMVGEPGGRAELEWESRERPATSPAGRAGRYSVREAAAHFQFEGKN